MLFNYDQHLLNYDQHLLNYDKHLFNYDQHLCISGLTEIFVYIQHHRTSGRRQTQVCLIWLKIGPDGAQMVQI